METLASKPIWADFNKGSYFNELTMELQDHGDRLVLQFVGGPTGYEAYNVKDLLEGDFMKMKEPGTQFCICGGTGGWDRCEVDFREVQSFLGEHTGEDQLQDEIWKDQ